MKTDYPTTGDFLTLLKALTRYTTQWELQAKETIFSQGDAADALFLIQRGLVKLTVESGNGHKAVLRILREGDIFGEQCMKERGVRNATATTIEPSLISRASKGCITRAIRREPVVARLLMSHLLRRVARLEEDLVSQILNSSEERLARILSRMARLRDGAAQSDIVGCIDQETLAEMVGTTRSRVSYFMNRFRRLGLIDYNGTVQVNSSLLTFLSRR